jgi:hypothetical protein
MFEATPMLLVRASGGFSSGSPASQSPGMSQSILRPSSIFAWGRLSRECLANESARLIRAERMHYWSGKASLVRF